MLLLPVARRLRVNARLNEHQLCSSLWWQRRLEDAPQPGTVDAQRRAEMGAKLGVYLQGWLGRRQAEIVDKVSQQVTHLGKGRAARCWSARPSAVAGDTGSVRVG